MNLTHNWKVADQSNFYKYLNVPMGNNIPVGIDSLIDTVLDNTFSDSPLEVRSILRELGFV